MMRPRLAFAPIGALLLGCPTTDQQAERMPFATSDADTGEVEGGSSGAVTLDDPPASEDGSSSGGEGSSSSGGDDPFAGLPPFEGCEPPPGVSGSPSTIEEAVDLINALPKPVTIECFVEALDRPLGVNATTSAFSAQPAEGEIGPRLFLMLDGLVLSVVVAGNSQKLLEFGEVVGETDSRKAELEFPIEGEIAYALPFAKVEYNPTISICAFCHNGERRDPLTTEYTAYISEAFRPNFFTVYEYDELLLDWQTCEHDPEYPERCGMLEAVFGQGQVDDQPFSEQLRTFFN